MELLLVFVMVVVWPGILVQNVILPENTMLIPEKMLLHMLNTGEYVEDREAGTITVIISKGEVYTAHVDEVYTELMNFIRVMNKRSEGVGDLMNTFVETDPNAPVEKHDCGHEHHTKDEQCEK